MPQISEVVTLRGGLTTPVAAVRLLWSLESEGFQLTPGPAGLLTVAPKARLTPEHVRAIRQFKPDLLALVAYAETVQ